MDVKYSECVKVILIFITGQAFGWTCIEPVQRVFCTESQECTLNFSVAAHLSSSKSFALENYNGTSFGNVYYSNGQTYPNQVAGTKLTADIAGNIWLTLSSVQRSSAGTYVVGLLQSSWPCITVFILGKPETPIILKDRDPSVGENVTLTCSSTSTTTPTNHSLSLVFNWRVDSVDNPSGSRYTYSASRHTLTLSSVGKGDANKQFTCTATEDVTDGYTSARSTVVSVSVFYGPESVEFSPSNTTYELEENTELPQITCSAACNPVCSFQWIKLTIGQQVGNNNILQLGNLQVSDVGTYRCTATRSGPVTNSKDLTLNVIYGPSSAVLSPSGGTVRKNEGTTLSSRTCSAQCWQCEYRWSGPGGYSSQGAVLNLGTLDRSEHGEYTCTASNTKLSRPAKTVSIVVEVRYGPDSVVLSPANTTYTVDEFDYVDNIICSADCFPSCSFSWTRMGQAAIVSITGTLPLGTIKKEYMGNYTCTAQNTEISPLKSDSANTQLYVRYGPYPESTTLSPEQTVHIINENDVLTTVTCHADCYPYCSYTWTKLRDGLTSVVFITAVLDLGTVNRTDAATYICTAINKHKRMNNSTQKEVQVKVNYGPDGACDNVSSLQTFTEGDKTASIECFSECYPSCSYTWSNGSGLLSNTEKLSLGSVRRHQAGNYTFTVSNSAQTYSKSEQRLFAVVVRYAPVVSIAFSTTSHLEGTSLTLFCRGEGVPSIYTYTGLTQEVGGVQIPNWNTALEGTATNSSIHFSKLQLQDMGNYTCRMNNGILDLSRILDQTGTVQLLVEVWPKILEDDLRYAGAQSKPITIQVPFYCYPAVRSVTFVRYDGTVIQNSTKYGTSFMPGAVYDTFYGKEVTLNGFMAVLVINDLEEEDFVNYTLVVNNSRGTTSELIFIVSESIPSIPKGFFLSASGLLLIWEKGFNGGHLQTFIIQVSAHGKEEWQNLSSIHENEASHRENSTFYSVKIGDLDPGTYSARLIAANSFGETEPLYLNTTFTVMSYESTTDKPSQIIAAAAGGSISAFVLVIGGGVIIMWRRRAGNYGKKTSKPHLKKHSTDVHENDSDDEDVEVENPMYVSAGPQNKPHDTVYAKANKKSKAEEKSSDVYAVVNKPKAANKEKKKKAKQTKSHQEGDIYENAPKKSGDAITYGNAAFESPSYETTEISGKAKKSTNEDGLMYVDIAFSKTPKGKKLVIHGLDDRTPYAQVDFTKHADPLPESDTEEPEQTPKKQSFKTC